MESLYLYDALARMSNAELLRVFYGEAAPKALESAGSLRALFVSEPLPEYRAQHRFFHAANELVRRALAEEIKKSEIFNSPALVREFLVRWCAPFKEERFLALWVDSQHRLIGVSELFRGTVSQTSVYPREVVRAALAHHASAVIFAHNHPSGQAEPSRADEHLTENLKKALVLVDVRVLDHFIVGETTVVSFSERGLL